jgi:hypothetical protein
MFGYNLFVTSWELQQVSSRSLEDIFETYLRYPASFQTLLVAVYIGQWRKPEKERIDRTSTHQNSPPKSNQSRQSNNNITESAPSMSVGYESARYLLNHKQNYPVDPALDILPHHNLHFPVPNSIITVVGGTYPRWLTFSKRSYSRWRSWRSCLSSQRSFQVVYSACTKYRPTVHRLRGL